MFHDEHGLGGRHAIHNWEYADATARLAATGFTAADVKKIALQLDDNSIWILTDDSPVTWKAAGGTGAVTATGTLTANAVVMGNGGVETKSVAGVTTDGTSRIQLGVAGTSVGGVELRNATSGTVSIVPPTGALGTAILTTPIGTDTLTANAATQTLTNKTLTAPVIATITNGAATLTLPTVTSTLFGSATKADVLEAALFAADAGSTDAYVIALSPAITAYVTGAHYRFKANTANTGACTIDINGVGAKTIKKAAGGITTDLATNDILAGQWVDLVYDGTNMQMQSLLGNAGGGSGTVNSGTAGRLAYYATSTTAVSEAVLPKFEVAAADNLSDYTFYNVLNYPFAKTDTTGRNAFGIVSNDADASNPFGMTLNMTGHASTALSRKVKIDVGGVGAAQAGTLQFNVGSFEILTTTGTGDTTLKVTGTASEVCIEAPSSNEGIWMKPNGTGYFHVGAAAYSPLGTYTIYNSFEYPFAKTDTSARNVFFIGSNDASNPFGVLFNITGNATAASRVAQLSVGAVGADNGGELRLGGTKVTQYWDNAGSLTLGATLDTSGLTVVKQVIAGATSTSQASFRAPHGTAPSSPVDGDIWTTTAGLFVRINGATVGPLS